MVETFNDKINKMMRAENHTKKMLNEMNDLNVIDELIVTPERKSITDEFHLNFSSIKKELMETTDFIIVKAAAEHLKNALTAVEQPGVTLENIAKDYSTNTVELLHMFESLYGSMETYYTGVTDRYIQERSDVKLLKNTQHSSNVYQILAGISCDKINEQIDEIEEKSKRAHHEFSQSAHDWVSVKVEELYPKYIKDKGEAYGRAWNEYKSKH